jgi:hypothetical protein
MTTRFPIGAIMRGTPTTWILSLLVWGLAAGVSHAQAAPQAPAFEPCPPTVRVEQKVGTPPPGWTVSQDKIAPELAQVTFFDGAPEELASLVYDQRQDKGAEMTAVWNFGGPKQAARGIWMSCSYSRTTTVLERKLPAATKACTVIYDKQTTGPNGTPTIKTITCR